ncbi:MAG: carboxylesterase/lipase family protein [Lachnospirales bacterium]
MKKKLVLTVATLLFLCGNVAVDVKAEEVSAKDISAVKEANNLEEFSLKIFYDVHGKEMIEATKSLYDLGIVKGNKGNLFNPEKELSVAEIMAFLGRVVNSDTEEIISTYEDYYVSDGWSDNYVAWGFERDLLTKDESNKINSSDLLSKVEVNEIINKFNTIYGTAINEYATEVGTATRGNFVQLLAAAPIVYEPSAIVHTEKGDIQGFKSIDSDVNVYKGIPYAKAPIGDLRWKAPQPVDSWEGTLMCTNWSASAIQPEQAPFWVWTDEFIIEDTGYSEDSLYLNVWSEDNEVENKPVLVYIHGGGLTSGGSSCEVYNGENIAENDIVFVSINYRVGSLGFMASEELSAESETGTSGNYGILDQIEALKWVQDNISAFGGDPSNVTIMGQSAGSLSVSSLVQTPLAKGLFNKAITQSYSTINSQIATLDEVEKTYEEFFGSYTLDELRAMSTEEIIAINNTGKIAKDGYVFSEDYKVSNEEGTVNDVALMSGFVPGDTLLFGTVSGTTVDEYEANVQTVFGDLAEEVLQIYPATEETLESVIQEVNVDNLVALEDMLVKERTASGYTDTYIYQLTHVMPDAAGGIFGAFHTSDVPYFLNNLSEYRADYWQDTDYALAHTMSNYLINFVKTGNPNASGLPVWENNKGNYSYLDAGDEVTYKNLSPEKITLFETFYGYNEK